MAAGTAECAPCDPRGSLPPYRSDPIIVWWKWAALFGDREVVFAISYLLQNDGPRIIGYVSHEDQAERMAAEGLDPGT